MNVGAIEVPGKSEVVMIDINRDTSSSAGKKLTDNILMNFAANVCLVSPGLIFDTDNVFINPLISLKL